MSEVMDYSKAVERHNNSKEDCITDQLTAHVMWVVLKEIQRIIYPMIGKRVMKSTPILVSVERFQEELKNILQLYVNYTQKQVKK